MYVFLTSKAAFDWLKGKALKLNFHLLVHPQCNSLIKHSYFAES